MDVLGKVLAVLFNVAGQLFVEHLSGIVKILGEVFNELLEVLLSLWVALDPLFDVSIDSLLSLLEVLRHVLDEFFVAAIALAVFLCPDIDLLIHLILSLTDIAG